MKKSKWAGVIGFSFLSLSLNAQATDMMQFGRQTQKVIDLIALCPAAFAQVNGDGENPVIRVLLTEGNSKDPWSDQELLLVTEERARFMGPPPQKFQLLIKRIVHLAQCPKGAACEPTPPKLSATCDVTQL